MSKDTEHSLFPKGKRGVIMNKETKDKIALELKIIAGDLKYATDLHVEDFENMAYELREIGITILHWVEAQD